MTTPAPAAKAPQAADRASALAAAVTAIACHITGHPDTRQALAALGVSRAEAEAITATPPA